ncbi:hypothetical protein [Ferrovum sp.]|uniref:Cas10/Cmr2 second palm domain-containing protein n=1 Tax=Ferrovum sp. TaxID=2609467 RepID=UPI00261031C6|nr:hypothetical protein [Ferrovum sp.]
MTGMSGQVLQETLTDQRHSDDRVMSTDGPVGCLIFEVKSIQSFIFSSGRLRDAIGGSELIDRLTNHEAKDNLLDAVLAATQASGIEFSRRAGGAFYAFCRDHGVLDRFAALWLLAVQQAVPSLGFVLGRGEGDSFSNAFSKAQKDLRSHNSRERTHYPIPVPIAERARRTGRVAVQRDSKDGAIDVVTQRNKPFADLSQAGFIHRYSPPEAHLKWEDWPRSLETEDVDGFPFVRGMRDVAMIHADGNGMGQVLIKINETVKQHSERFLEIYTTFSQAVERSTCHGAQQAALEVLLPIRQKGELLAARPILLGGDDVIVLVRADLALAYIQVFARAFEEESRRQLQKLTNLEVKGLPDKLTLGFGVAFIGASQPFSMAATLAESLMSHAKTRAKQSEVQDIAPSSVVFYRVTTALMEDYSTLVKKVLTHYEGEADDGDTNSLSRRRAYIHTLGTYVLSADKNVGSLPRLSDLEALTALLQGENMARGPVRGLLNLLQLDPAQARTSWRRWRQLLHDKQPQKLSEFDRYLQVLMPRYQPDADLPYALCDDGHSHQEFCSPLGDALELLALDHRALATIQQQEVMV